MKQSWTIVLCFLLAGSGCGKRAAPAADGAVQLDLASPDTWAPGDGPVPADASGACNALTRIGQVTLEFADTMKTTPAIAFDGERFAVVWHSQPAPVSSLNGELRFALVDRTGKPSAPDGVSLGGDDGALEPALLAAPKEYAVLHRPSGAGPDAVLRRVDAAGKTIGTLPINGQVSVAALARHPAGFAVLTAPQGGVPKVMVLDTSGSVTATTPFITAQVMASLWLAQRPGGYAAVLHSTNKNAELYLLDAQVAQVGIASVGGMVQSPSFAVLPNGFAALYLGAGSVEARVFDSTGTSIGKQSLGTATISAVADPSALTGLAWTGQRLVAGYPSTVPGQLVLRLLDETGHPVGNAAPLTGCLATSSTIRMAWGKDLLAVASLAYASGVAKSCICVTLLRCQ